MIPEGAIFHIMRFALHDGPGIRTAVFFKGCPLACRWCHNPESQSADPETLLHADRCIHCEDCLRACPDGVSEAACIRCTVCAPACPAGARQVAGYRATAAEILRQIERDRIFFDESGGGVTFTGGEPLSQPDLLIALLAACRERSLHAVIETCGAVSRPALLRAASLASGVLYDLKILDPGRHREFTGAPNRNILENFAALLEAGGATVARIPVVPGINDRPQDIRDFRDFFGTQRPQRIDLLPYHRAGSEKYARLGRPYLMDGVQPPSPEHLAAIAGELRSTGIPVTIAN